VVPHVRGVPIGVLSVPTAAVLSLARQTFTGPLLVASWKATVLGDLFATGVSGGNPRGAPGSGTFRLARTPAGHLLAGMALYPTPPPAPEGGFGAAGLPPRPVVERDYSNVTGDPLTDNEGFLVALCRAALHREPTAEEIKSNTALLTRGLRRSQLVTQMLVSDEYRARKTSSGGFIRDAYQAVLGREPKPEELTMMARFLTSGGTFERDMIVATLMSTTEFHQLRTQLRRNGPRARKKPLIKTVAVTPAAPAAPASGHQLYYDCLTAYNRLVTMLSKKPTPAEAAVHAAWLRQARKDYDLALVRYNAVNKRL
jgi:hypothetical protein